MEWSDIVPMAEAQFPDRPGLYKLFLHHRGALAGTILAQEPKGALLYVGKAAKEGLRSRHEEQHLAEESGWSTCRRSLGAMLAEKLSLTAVPRRRSPHKSNYSFDQHGEQRLTEWMLRSLAVSWTTSVPTTRLKSEEKRLVRALSPVLNITHNTAGRYVPALKRLRAACCEEMRRQV